MNGLRQGLSLYLCLGAPQGAKQDHHTQSKMEGANKSVTALYSVTALQPNKSAHQRRVCQTSTHQTVHKSHLWFCL